MHHEEEEEENEEMVRVPERLKVLALLFGDVEGGPQTASMSPSAFARWRSGRDLTYPHGLHGGGVHHQHGDHKELPRAASDGRDCGRVRVGGGRKVGSALGRRGGCGHADQSSESAILGSAARVGDPSWRARFDGPSWWARVGGPSWRARIPFCRPKKLK